MFLPKDSRQNIPAKILLTKYFPKNIPAKIVASTTYPSGAVYSDSKDYRLVWQ